MKQSSTIPGLIPQNCTELAEAVPIGILLYVGPEIYYTNLSFHMAHMTLCWLCHRAAKFRWNILINLYLKL